jgi:hypothetical protein
MAFLASSTLAGPFPFFVRAGLEEPLSLASMITEGVTVVAACPSPTPIRLVYSSAGGVGAFGGSPVPAMHLADSLKKIKKWAHYWSYSLHVIFFFVTFWKPLQGLNPLGY